MSDERRYHTLSLRFTDDHVLHFITSDPVLAKNLEEQILNQMEIGYGRGKDILAIAHGITVPPASEDGDLDLVWEKLERVLDPTPLPEGLELPAFDNADHGEENDHEDDTCDCPACRLRRQQTRIH